MKASELRIGNLILSHDRTEFMVKTISGSKHGIYAEDIKTKEGFCITSDYCCGIPLTEEWLFKLGFEKGKTGGYGGYHGYSNGVMEVDNDFNLTLYDGRMSEDSTKDFGPDLTYVHQLQNLYFALTGQELEINL